MESSLSPKSFAISANCNHRFLPIMRCIILAVYAKSFLSLDDDREWSLNGLIAVWSWSQTFPFTKGWAGPRSMDKSWPHVCLDPERQQLDTSRVVKAQSAAIDQGEFDRERSVSTPKMRRWFSFRHPRQRFSATPRGVPFHRYRHRIDNGRPSELRRD